MWTMYESCWTYINRFSSHEWMLVLVGVVAWGLFCMRGYGSRKGY